MHFHYINLIGLINSLAMTVDAWAFNADGGTLAMPIQRNNHHAASPLARRLASRDPAGTLNQVLTYLPLGIYYVNITVGTPAQSMAVQLDTGSADLWVPDITSSACQKSSCSIGGFNPQRSSSYLATGTFDSSYGSSKNQGIFMNETVSLAGGVTIQGMQMGLVNQTQSLLPINFGIMGISFDTQEAQVISGGQQPYPNIMDRLLSSRTIHTRTYSLYLDDLNAGQGSIIFGGVDTAKFQSPLGVVNIIPNSQDNKYDSMTVALTALSYTQKGVGSATAILNQGQGIAAVLDSGTSRTVFEDDLVAEIWGGLGLANDGSIAWTACDADLSDYYFTFTFGGADGVSVSVGLDQFLEAPQADLGLPETNGQQSCVFGITPSDIAGVNILGDNFLRSVYVVYDLDDYQIGLAPTIFNVAESNIIALVRPSGAASTAADVFPSASTIPNQVSISYAVQPTYYPGAGGGPFGAASSIISNSISTPTATFQGIPTNSLAGSSTSKSAAHSIRLPPFDWITITVPGMAALFSILSATLFLILR